jgi:membrane protease YdiL (CAAX protease family)
VVGPNGFPGTSEEVERLMPYAILAFVVGPALAGPLLTGFVYGKAGLREFLIPVAEVGVAGCWYAVALLTAPLLMTTVLLALSLFSRQFVPGIFTSDEKSTLLLVGLATALVAGFFEELGWTGFAIPRLRQHHGVLGTGFIAACCGQRGTSSFIFGRAGQLPGPVSFAGYLLDAFLFLTLFRVLMVWVYDRTGSLLVAMLMHGSLTASARILMPPGTTGVRLLTFDLVWVAALCVVIAAVAFSNREQLSRRPLQRRMA